MNDLSGFLQKVAVVELLSCVWLWCHGLKHSRPPYPSLSPGVFPSSCQLSQWCYPTTDMLSFSAYSSLFAFNLSQQQDLFNDLAISIRWLNYRSFSFSISVSSEYSGLISFRIHWFDLLAVQRTLIIFSSTTIWKHNFFNAWPSLQSNSHIHA